MILKAFLVLGDLQEKRQTTAIQTQQNNTLTLPAKQAKETESTQHNTSPPSAPTRCRNKMTERSKEMTEDRGQRKMSVKRGAPCGNRHVSRPGCWERLPCRLAEHVPSLLSHQDKTVLVVAIATLASRASFSSAFFFMHRCSWRLQMTVRSTTECVRYVYANALSNATECLDK